MRVSRPAATVPGASRAQLPTTMTTEHVFPQALQAGNLAQATGGLTLRDYFAAKAMQGLISSSDAVASITKAADDNGRNFEAVISTTAYILADAMLQARQSTTTK